ncbi:MAG: hypothetical protein ACRENA_07835 [Vulcanimicrobiaceae bacterium]
MMSHDSGVWQHRLAIPEIVAGIGMLHPRTAYAATIALGTLYVVFSLACIPGIVAAPASYVQYGNFFEQFSVVCGALSAFASRVARAVARLGLGLCAASFATAQAVYFHFTASLVPAWIPESPSFWVMLTTIAFAMAAIALLVNVQAPLAMRLMSLMIALFGVMVWIPQIAARPAVLGNWSEFAESFLIAAAAWTLANRTRSLGPLSMYSQARRRA